MKPGRSPLRVWGTSVDPQSIQQIETACALPVAVRGALMPDAHVGYGLPIGGVLATEASVIPYAVGVDIACRVKMSVFDLPPKALESQTDRLTKALEDETRFGIGAEFKSRAREHPVLEADWSISPVTSRSRDKAWRQLGTSGSGNHFVEYGILRVEADGLGLDSGSYLALLSHSGSRGVGAAVCDHYSRVAMQLHPELKGEAKRLAWLSLDHDTGREYWAAMSLMGEYASANHAVIHRAIAKRLGAKVLADFENHHNFAWKETHDGREVIVHRKGATPAGRGVIGVIPGTMASPTFVVRGLGDAASMNSAAHGAGRVMSRRKARQSFRWSHARPLLKERGVTLLSAGIDEAPMVYKDIEQVMREQDDLVETLGRFDPRIVKMAPEGERAED